MNCETCQELIHDLVDGHINQNDESILNTHLSECLDCESVRQDLATIVGFARTRRGEYEAPPNEQALWLRIRNVIEADQGGQTVVSQHERRPSFLGRLMGHTWELSLPQLTAATAAIVLLVALTTVVGLRRWGTGPVTQSGVLQAAASDVNDRFIAKQQAISYWNQRIEQNKARWSPRMRETFEISLQVVDQAVTKSTADLKQKPDDDFSEQMLDAAMEEKIALLQKFDKMSNF
jgi:anti-sigma factor RsiW